MLETERRHRGAQRAITGLPVQLGHKVAEAVYVQLRGVHDKVGLGPQRCHQLPFGFNPLCDTARPRVGMRSATVLVAPN